MVINCKEKFTTTGEVDLKKLSYNWHNPLSFISFIFLYLLFIFQETDKNKNLYIYHYGYPSIEDIIILKFAKILGFKIVYDIVENISYFNNKKKSFKIKFKNYTSKILLRQLYKNGDLCFGISKNLVNFLKKICKDKVPVVHLPISVNIESIESFVKPSKDNCSIKIFYGGSFGYKDGIDILIKGFELACDNHKNIELLLTGKISKEMKDELPLIIKNSKWSERIHFLGLLSINNYYDTMVNSDILCVPRVNSEYANAGFPFKLGEFLASGKPIIVSDVGDINQYLKDKVNAIIIKAQSEQEICKAISLLIDDPSLRKKIGTEGKVVAISNFASNKVTGILINNILSLKKD